MIEDIFWHEKNSLRFVDKIETLPDPIGNENNLDLTYAVRDGIICHCGEINENSIYPREEFVDLSEIIRPNQFSPYTWEGCVVKIADKISYLGRDIEDAITLKILDRQQMNELVKIIKTVTEIEVKEVNNTILMHYFILNLCKSSNPKDGICFSENYLTFINLIKTFNYKNIYLHKRLNYYKKYATVVIESIYDFLSSCYKGAATYSHINSISKSHYTLSSTFSEWLLKYSNADITTRTKRKYKNHIIYDVKSKSDYIRAILDYISGMSDNFAIKCFNEIMRF